MYYLHNLYLRDIFYFFLKINSKKTFKESNINDSVHEKLKDLERDGLTHLSEIEYEVKVKELLKLVNSHDLKFFDPWNSPEKKYIFHDIPDNTHTAHLCSDSNSKVLDSISEIAESKEILDLVSLYLGCDPIIDNISLWWSFPTNEDAKEAEFFHRDFDSPKFLKLFIYLTNVDLNSGPHSYVLGSHKINKKIYNRRFTEEEVLSCFNKKNEIKILGSEGKIFLADTFGMHRGFKPILRNRLIAQVRFSANKSIFRYQGNKISSHRKKPYGINENLVINYNKN